MKHLSLLLCTLLLLALLPLGLDLPSTDNEATLQESLVEQTSVEESTLQMAYSETIGSDDSTYHFQPNGSSYTATNPAHNLSVDITDSALTVSIGDDTWQLSSDDAATDFTLNDNRLTIHRNSFDEWYINGPVGLQQGITLYEPAEVAFDVGGTLTTTASAQSLSLGDSLTFSGLMAYDADGQDVPVQFALADSKLAYVYDDVDAAYPLTIDPWLQQQQLTASDLADYDNFGAAVAISDGTALISAIGDDCMLGVQNCGSVYVFTRENGIWTEQQKLKASDATAGAKFGSDIALSGETAAIGATYDNCVTGEARCGAVYIFTRTNNSWTEQAKLTASDAAWRDYFGEVAVDGDTVLVGARRDDCAAGNDCGSVYVFTRTGTTWTEAQKLTASDPAPSDQFGIAVALEGDTAMIGSWSDDCANGQNCGSVYLFTRNGGVWSEYGKLTASDADNGDLFGRSVDLQGDTAIIGAIGAISNISSVEDQGLVYIFVRNAGVWTEQDIINPADPSEFKGFGIDVSLDGETALIGTYFDNCADGQNCGSAYIFTRSGTVWTQQAKLVAADAQRQARFGSSVAIDSDTVLIGARQTSCAGTITFCGSAYVFSNFVPETLNASADCNGPNLEVNIGAGNGPFSVIASAGVNTPLTGVSTGTHIINGPEKWDDVTITETSGDLESINLGQFKCRTDERPIPVWPPHRARITTPQPLFTWIGITDTNNYRIFLFDNKVAADRTVDIRQNSGGPTQLILRLPLEPGRYFWRVRGRQNRVWSLWSIRFTLFVDPPAIAPFTNSTPIPVVAPNSRATVAPLPTSEPPSNDTPTLPAPPNSR